MRKIQVFAILALGGLVALGASGQTGQSGDTTVYPPTPAGEYASPAADVGAADQTDQTPDATVTLVEPYDGYGELSLDELSAALSMPAGPEPWDLGEFARWQEPPALDAYSEQVIIIDEGQAIVGTFELPAEDEGWGELAEAQPQALPVQPAPAFPAAPAPALAGAQPVVPDVPPADNALTRAYGAAGTVYATTAEYYCEPPMYAPVYSSYYYAYPYAYASRVPPWWNPHWPLSASYYSYSQWPYDYSIYLGYPYVGYVGTYGSYSYGGCYGTYASFPYTGYFGTYASYPYTGYFGTYIGYPYSSYYRSYPHGRYFGSGSLLSFSFGGSSWGIYGQLGISAHQNRYFRSGHDRDDFLRHSGSRSIAHGGASSARPFASGVTVRPWRPSVSHQVAAARNGRSFDLSTDRSRLGLRGPVDLNRRALTTAAGAGSARATALPRPPGRTLTTGRTSALAAPAVGRAGSTLSTSPRATTGVTAQVRLQQRRDAYMDVLRGRNADSGGTAGRSSAGDARPAFGATPPAGTASSAPLTDRGFGAGNVSRRSSAPDIDPAVTARREAMRNDLLRRLNAMPGGSGAAPATTGPTRPHSTFQPQVTPRQPISPGGSSPAGPRSLTPRSLTPQSSTPRTWITPTATPRSLTPRAATTPSVTITPTPRTTSTAPPPEMRFSRSTWPHNSTATPDTTTPRTFTPRTFAPSQAAPNATPSRSYTPRTFTPRTFTPSDAAPSTSTPTRSYMPSTFTPRTFTPSQAAPSTSTPTRSYTPSTFTPRTFTPSRATPSTSTPTRSYTPSTFTPRTFTPSRSAPSTSTPTRSYTPSTFTPRTFAPSSAAPSFSRSTPSSSRFSPTSRSPSGPIMSAPPARTYSPAPSQSSSMSRNTRSSSSRSPEAAPAEETAPTRRRR